MITNTLHPAPDTELLAPGPRTGDPRMTRDHKFRQAAMFYVLVGLVYEASVFVAWREGFAPTDRGPPWLFLFVIAPLVLGFIVWGLWSWRNVWLARVLVGFNAVRVVAVFGPGFVPDLERNLSPAFYQLETVLLLANLWMLARAGWDL